MYVCAMTAFQIPSQSTDMPCSLYLLYFGARRKEMWARRRLFGDQSINAPHLTPAVTRNCSFRCSGTCSSSFISLIHSAFNHFTKKVLPGLKKKFCRTFLSVAPWYHRSSFREREVCQILEGCGTNPGQGWKSLKMQLKVDVCSLGWHPWWLNHHPVALCTCHLKW